MSDQHPPVHEDRLSQQAAARREALLESLRPVVARRGRVRRARRTSGVGALLLVALAAAWWVARPAMTPPAKPRQLATTTTNSTNPLPTPVETRELAPPPAPTPPRAAPASRVTIAIVRDDPTIVARWSVDPKVDVQIATNAELQAALIETGQRPGLVKIGGTMMLASQMRR